jgi:hypothetical protein
MEVIRDGLYFCSDCTFVAVNGPSGIDISVDRLQEVFHGIAELARTTEAETGIQDARIVPDFDSNAETDTGIEEFSSVPCASCHSTLAGYRAHFAMLGQRMPRLADQ